MRRNDEVYLYVPYNLSVKSDNNIFGNISNDVSKCEQQIPHSNQGHPVPRGLGYKVVSVDVGGHTTYEHCLV